jgi:hypothetical protein
VYKCFTADHARVKLGHVYGSFGMYIRGEPGVRHHSVSGFWGFCEIALSERLDVSRQDTRLWGYLTAKSQIRA